MYRCVKKKGRDSCIRCVFDDDAGIISYGRAMELLQTDDAFMELLIKVMRGVSFQGYFWELPAIISYCVYEKPFEFVIINSQAHVKNGSLPDPRPFQEHMIEDGICVFNNKGKDATLIVPCIKLDKKEKIGGLDFRTKYRCYAHIANFVRYASDNEISEFFKSMAAIVMEKISEGYALWVSTSGLGVNWLHIRIDNVPKYYTHTAYKLL